MTKRELMCSTILVQEVAFSRSRLWELETSQVFYFPEVGDLYFW